MTAAEKAAAELAAASALRKAGRYEEALRHYDKAIALKPDYAQAFNNRGNVLKALDRFSEALASYDKAIAIEPGYAAAHNNRGSLFYALDRPQDALADYNRALGLNPDFAEALGNRGNLLIEFDRAQEALADCERALTLKPGYAGAQLNRGNALLQLKRLDEAIASYDRLVALHPGHAEAIKNRGMCKLLAGCYREGFKDFERRWDVAGFPGRRPAVAAPQWLGETLEGKTILVYAEQGAGDIIQFARYLPLLRERGASVIFLGSTTLRRLLRPFAHALIGSEAELERTPDYQCPLMSLPLHFGTELASIPRPVPYLRAEPDLIARWSDEIGAHGLKIGIAWQGKPGGRLDRGRSIPLREFLELARIPGVRLISLQKQFGLEQLNDLAEPRAVERLSDFDTGPDAFIDTAAAMASLDLVITPDTSIAHLAGALGRPVWVALKSVPDWRWLLDRSDCPWYPSMRLFRQKTPGDWGTVLEDIGAQLRNFSRASGRQAK